MLNGNIKDREKAQEHFRIQNEKKQEAIDLYNFYTCNEIDPAFQTIQLRGRDIIVRMHKENWIKGIQFQAGDVPMYDAWVSQVDGRAKQTHSDKWVDNPLPYVFTGVIVAMSPTYEHEIQKDYERILEKNPDTTYQPLKIGDIVHIQKHYFVDNLFYLNKQDLDFIKNPEDYRIEHWEGYIRMNAGMIEALVTDKEAFFSNMSPYQQYQAALEAHKEAEAPALTTEEIVDLNE
jgi:hypothetical protein